MTPHFFPSNTAYPRALLLIGSIACLCGVSAAQRDSTALSSDSSSHIVNLDKIVVTATRTERKMSQTPASVTSISAEEIQAAPARGIDDLIQYAPGVQVRRPVGMGEGVPSDIIMRGIPGALAASRMLILVDGIPTNASGAPFLIFNEIPLEAVQNIEIVRGPYSSLYGANAFGGVINIITKKGDGRPGLEGFLETSYPFTGAYNYLKTNGLHGDSLWKQTAEMSLFNIGAQSSGGTDQWNYLACGGLRSIGNYLVRDYVIYREPDTVYRRPARNYNYRDYRLFGRAGLRLSPRVQAGLNLRYFNSDLGFGVTRESADTSDVNILGEKFLAGPWVSWRATDNLDLRFSGYYRHIYGKFANEAQTMRGTPPATYPVYVLSSWDARASDGQVEGQAIYTFGHNQVITAGFDALSNNIIFGAISEPDGTPIGGSKSVNAGIANLGLYAQDEIALIDSRMRLTPGFRYDYHSEFGGAWSPKMGVSYQLFAPLRLRLSSGRAFRAPTLTELYLTLPIKPGFNLNPNAHLKPEYLWASEAGMEATPHRTVRLTADYFFNYMQDLVVPRVDFLNLRVVHGNAGTAWSQGVETNGEWQPVPECALTANYVWQISRDVMHDSLYRQYGRSFPPDTFDRISLDNIPNHTVHAGIRAGKRLGDWELSASLTEGYIGARMYLDWMAPLDEKTVNYWHALPDPRNFATIFPGYVKLPSYWRTDLSVRLAFREWLWLDLNAQNIFNAVFEESGGTYAPGRLVTVRVGGKI